ncbi:MAG: hypothetical protein GQ570_08545 [Helicobacteraceae bacterium]|nr:hypothetical protein [Helicobacteraceae bacterium]
MIDIQGKTQEQIEVMFSRENMNEEIAIALSKWIDQIDTQYYFKLQEITGLNEDLTNELMYNIIALLGNKAHGKVMDTDFPHIREFDINQLVLGISSFLDSEDTPWKYNTAMDILAEFDTVFYDLSQENKLSDQDHWYTETTAIVSFTIAEDADKLLQYSRYKLPLIEAPLEWIEGIAQGGYHLDTSKVTLNKGNAKQPQNVLDVLNKLQSQQFTLREWDMDTQFNYILANLKEKNWKKDEAEHLKSALIRLQTAQETYETMENRQFYFAWKYDFRLRAYCSGYDITLHGDSYQKSLVKPVLTKDNT